MYDSFIQQYGITPIVPDAVCGLHIPMISQLCQQTEIDCDRERHMSSHLFNSVIIHLPYNFQLTTGDTLMPHWNSESGLANAMADV